MMKPRRDPMKYLNTKEEIVSGQLDEDEDEESSRCIFPSHGSPGVPLPQSIGGVYVHFHLCP